MNEDSWLPSVQLTDVDIRNLLAAVLDARERTDGRQRQQMEDLIDKLMGLTHSNNIVGTTDLREVFRVLAARVHRVDDDSKS